MTRARLSLLVLPLALVAACSTDATAPVDSPAERKAAPPAASGVTVVMSGLRSPRGLDWGPNGALYVAEAGMATLSGGCVPFMEGTMLQTKCWSGTGGVSRLWRGEQTRIASDLPSSYIVHSGFASGPQDISIAGGRLFVTLGWGGHPDLRADLGGDAVNAGTLIQMQPSGNWHVVADISGFEAEQNPDGGPVDSNPYGLLAESNRRFVADAGGNSLLEVAANGRISLVSTFPAIAVPPPFMTAEAVPTRVRRGPDGALYVSTLRGVPFLDGSAQIYRVVPGSAPVVYAAGFKSITDFVFTPDGGMYVLQFATGPMFFAGPGVLIHVAPNGTRTVVHGALEMPTGLALGSDGSVYVSHRGTSSTNGEVLRIVP